MMEHRPSLDGLGGRGGGREGGEGEVCEREQE